jgi:hypothetical protein
VLMLCAATSIRCHSSRREPRRCTRSVNGPFCAVIADERAVLRDTRVFFEANRVFAERTRRQIPVNLVNKQFVGSWIELGHKVTGDIRSELVMFRPALRAPPGLGIHNLWTLRLSIPCSVFSQNCPQNRAAASARNSPPRPRRSLPMGNCSFSICIATFPYTSRVPLIR